MIHSRRAAALCLLALAFSAAPAARIGRSVFERVEAPRGLQQAVRTGRRHRQTHRLFLKEGDFVVLPVIG